MSVVETLLLYEPEGNPFRIRRESIIHEDTLRRWQCCSWSVNPSGLFRPTFDSAEIDRTLKRVGAEG